MKKVWSYVSAALVGVIGGIAIALKFLVPAKVVFKGKVKLKQRGRGNEQMTEIKPNIDVKTERKQRREKKKNE